MVTSCWKPAEAAAGEVQVWAEWEVAQLMPGECNDSGGNGNSRVQAALQQPTCEAESCWQLRLHPGLQQSDSEGAAPLSGSILGCSGS